jgi:hypothetical protein
MQKTTNPSVRNLFGVKLEEGGMERNGEEWIFLFIYITDALYGPSDRSELNLEIFPQSFPPLPQVVVIFHGSVLTNWCGMTTSIPCPPPHQRYVMRSAIHM